MDGKLFAQSIAMDRHFLSNAIGQFEPQHADFRPVDGMMTVSQQIRHIGATLLWFQEGAFGTGFDMDFAKHEVELRNPVTLDQAKAELDAAWDQIIGFVEKMTEAELQSNMAPNPIMGPIPKELAVGGAMDHTAHHRGILTVYLRMLGITPKMIYSPPEA